MVEDNEQLDAVYGAKDASATRKTYDNWAAEYDSENIGNGYRVPALGCAMVTRHVGLDAGPIFDAACGTGLIGEMLKMLGYQDIIGADLSEGMLEIANSVNAYKRLQAHDLNDPIPEPDNSFAAVTCFGSLGPGHAPAKCVKEFARITKPGGHVIFNTRAETYPEQELKQVVDGLSNSGAWSLVDETPITRSYYLIEPDVKFQVLVFRVT